MEESQASEQFYTTPSAKKRNTKKWLWILLIIILFIGGVGAIFVFFGGNKQETMAPSSVGSTSEPTVFVEPTSVPTPTEKPEVTSKTSPTKQITPTPAVTKSPTTTGQITSTATNGKLTIEVLNGSGVSGAATKMKTFLTDKGYTVSSTGNADTFDYQKTTIRITVAKKDMLSQLQKDLSTDYTVAVGDPLPSSSTTDAQVIVGKE